MHFWWFYLQTLVDVVKTAEHLKDAMYRKAAVDSYFISDAKRGGLICNGQADDK